ncbi:MAG: putative baseplate assembly protein [Cyanobacteria bacterium J06560_6]
MPYQQTDEQIQALDAFKALPQLPKPNLDDRTYRELVDECVLRIPRYCPEWSNHNPADPGITLIELFSWLTDQMLWRFNQVPWRQYISFLELLGVRLASPIPARTDLTFYLSRAQSTLDFVGPIQAETEVSTERTDNQEAVIFSTERRLEIGTPRICNFLLCEDIAESNNLSLGTVRDGFQRWRPEDDQGYRWSGREQLIFQPTPEVNNGFYLVLSSETLDSGDTQSLDGHVIELEIEGQLAGPTGIDPKRPPRCWEAWNGEAWQPVLLQEEDDETFGFSFDEMQLDHRGSRRARLILHMPNSWPEATFESDTGASYTGFGLRCVYRLPTYHRIEQLAAPGPEQPGGYSRSPKFTALAVSAIGGTVPAIQCTHVEDEFLGESTGKPGQQFSLQSEAILQRKTGEQLEITLPGEESPQQWREVSDFANSATHDLHYVLDSRTGVIQLGPLVREPAQLKESVQLRRTIQDAAIETPTVLDEDARLQQQYGEVPPKGATLRMTAYRTGGGDAGNVKPGALRILKSAVPYVTRVTNHRAAAGGTDAETLEQAVMRVPRLLRTRDRAVTTEDFETLAKEASPQVYRAHCSKQPADTAGKIVVLVVPTQPGKLSRTSRYELTKELKDTVTTYLERRSLLGIAIQVAAPEYVRVKVKAQVSLGLTDTGSALNREDVEQTLKQHLNQFLNPITGGWSGQGWAFGADLHESDIMGYLHKQRVAGVRSIGNIQLFAWDPSASQWMLKPERISLSSSQLLDTWESERHALDGHVIELM